jgi:hypothetical protein
MSSSKTKITLDELANSKTCSWGTSSQVNLSLLPLIPVSKELQDLPPLPAEQEELLRILARHAINIILERFKDGTLQTFKKDNMVEEENG